MASCITLSLSSEYVRHTLWTWAKKRIKVRISPITRVYNKETTSNLAQCFIKFNTKFPGHKTIFPQRYDNLINARRTTPRFVLIFATLGRVISFRESSSTTPFLATLKVFSKLHKQFISPNTMSICPHNTRHIIS